MKKITGNVNVTLTADEVVYINDLLEKDMPTPMGRFKYKSDALKDMPAMDACGRCGEPITGGHWKFCPHCGTRIDRENYKLEGGE